MNAIKVYVPRGIDESRRIEMPCDYVCIKDKSGDLLNGQFTYLDIVAMAKFCETGLVFENKKNGKRYEIVQAQLMLFGETRNILKKCTV